MRIATLRRLVAFVVALTLAVGLAAHYGAATTMSVKMATMAASDAPTPDKCDGCGSGGDGTSSGVCSAYCTAAAAALLPDGISFKVLRERTAPYVTPPTGAGWSVPPDPYPPRPTILS